MNEIIYASAKTMAREIKNKRISCVEIVEIHLDRISSVNPSLNAVVQICTERALSEARKADTKISRGEDIRIGKRVAILSG